MDIKYHEKNYHLSEKLRLLLEKKLERFNKFFDAGETTSIIVMTRVGVLEKLELTIMSKGHSFRAQFESKSMANNIDEVLEKIERQIVKNRDRLRTVIRHNAVQAKELSYVKAKQIGAFSEPEIKKNKSFSIKTLDDRQAQLELETLDHDFFIYADDMTKRVKVMYRRPDGHVGVIDVNNANVANLLPNSAKKK